LDCENEKWLTEIMEGHGINAEKNRTNELPAANEPWTVK
jgi:hypothetical protein